MTVDSDSARARAYWKGKRVQVPPHYDAWMRGDRYGVVVNGPGRKGGLLLRLDSGKALVVPADQITDVVDNPKSKSKNPTNWVEGTGPGSDSEYRGQLIRAGRVQRTAANPGNRGNDPLLCPSCNESMGNLPVGDYRHNPCGAKVRVK